jgi:hypothetical protein
MLKPKTQHLFWKLYACITYIDQKTNSYFVTQMLVLNILTRTPTPISYAYASIACFD